MGGCVGGWVKRGRVGKEAMVGGVVGGMKGGWVKGEGPPTAARVLVVLLLVGYSRSQSTHAYV